VQRSVSNRVRGAGSAKGTERKNVPVPVTLSEEAAGTLQKMAEATRMKEEILATEAIRRGMELLERR